MAGEVGKGAAVFLQLEKAQGQQAIGVWEGFLRRIRLRLAASNWPVR